MLHIDINRMYEFLVLSRMMTEEDIKTVIMELKNPETTGKFDNVDWTPSMRILGSALWNCLSVQDKEWYASRRTS